MQADSLYDEFDDCCDLSYIVDEDIPREYYDNKTASYKAYLDTRSQLSVDAIKTDMISN